MRLNNIVVTKERRRVLRSNMTDSERMLWNKLKGDKLGYRFRRQFSVGYYILDFYCPRKKLAIELDGAVHTNQKEYDKIRDKFIHEFGITVLHFQNEDIRININGVIRQIKNSLL